MQELLSKIEQSLLEQGYQEFRTYWVFGKYPSWDHVDGRFRFIVGNHALTPWQFYLHLLDCDCSSQEEIDWRCEGGLLPDIRRFGQLHHSNWCTPEINKEVFPDVYP